MAANDATTASVRLPQVATARIASRKASATVVEFTCSTRPQANATAAIRASAPAILRGHLDRVCDGITAPFYIDSSAVARQPRGRRYPLPYLSLHSTEQKCTTSPPMVRFTDVAVAT